MRGELGGSIYSKPGLLETLSGTSLSDDFVEACLNELFGKGLKIGSDVSPSASQFPPSSSRVTDTSSLFEVPKAEIKDAEAAEKAKQAEEARGGKKVKVGTKAKGGQDEKGGKEEKVWKWKYKSREQDYYYPLKDLLNLITDTIISQAPEIKRNFPDKTTIIYDRFMKDRVGESHPLKPDLLVTIHDDTRDDRNRGPKHHPSLFWKEVEMPVEVKKGLPEMFEQAATYARAVFSANLDRLFVLGLLVSTKGSLEIVCYSRSGACRATPSIQFVELDGMRKLIHAWTQVLATNGWKDETVFEGELKVNGKWSYKWAASGEIDRMICLRGRGTWVRRIVLGSNEPQAGDKRPASGVGTDLPVIPGRWSEGFSGRPPKSLIVKDSWPLKGSPNDWTIWKELKGYVGVPKVFGWEWLGDTEGFLPQSSEQWSLFQGQTWDAKVETRDHVRVFHDFDGESLLRVSGKLQINEIFEALRDCFLAIVALYRKGWLHRDISPGNIVVLNTPEERILPEEFQELLGERFKNRKCGAVVIDGDHGAKLDGSVANDEILTGTYDFMSMRLTPGAIYATEKIHTILDDLESIAWVLAYLLWPKMPPPPLEGDIFSILWESRGTKNLLGFKDAFSSNVGNKQTARAQTPSGYKEFIMKGLGPLFKTVKNASVSLGESIDDDGLLSSDIRPLCEKAIQEYTNAWFAPEVEQAFANASTPSV